jgi:hypothetical protein
MEIKNESVGFGLRRLGLILENGNDLVLRWTLPFLESFVDSLLKIRQPFLWLFPLFNLVFLWIVVLDFFNEFGQPILNINVHQLEFLRQQS